MNSLIASCFRYKSEPIVNSFAMRQVLTNTIYISLAIVAGEGTYISGQPVFMIFKNPQSFPI